jgi:WD40 repeat protein
MVLVFKDKSIGHLWNAENGQAIGALAAVEAATKITFSPGGTRAMTVSKDGTARVWDAANGMRLAKLSHDKQVSSAAFSHDGERVVTASNRAAWIWDAEGGEATIGDELARLAHDKEVTSAVFSPDGQSVVAVSDGAARVWDVTKGVSNVKLDHFGVVGATFSADGGRVLTEGNGVTRLWDRISGKEVVPRANRMELSSDGQRVMTYDLWEDTVTLWGVKKGEVIKKFDNVRGGVLNHDGTCVMTVSMDGAADLWCKGSDESSKALEGHKKAGAENAAFSPDGTRLVTTSEDRVARLWSVPGGKEIARLGHDEAFGSATFSPDGQRVVTVTKSGTARLWDATSDTLSQLLKGRTDLETAREPVVISYRFETASVWDEAAGPLRAILRGDDREIYEATFSADGRRVVTTSDRHAGGAAHLWDAQSGQLLNADLGFDESVSCPAVLSLDGRRVAIGFLDGIARVWDETKGMDPTVLEHDRGPVRSVAFGPKGERVVTASEDGTARVWDAAGGRQLAKLSHDKDVISAAFSPDGKRVVTTSSRAAWIWDADRDAAIGEQLAKLSHDKDVTSAAFSPDGKRVVTASQDDTARVWDAAGGEQFAKLSHDKDVTSAAFSPDGKRVVTISDGAARVWDAASGNQLSKFSHVDGYEIYSVVFTTDGKSVVTTSTDGRARLWRVLPRGQALIDFAHKRVPRSRLTDNEKKEYYVRK